MTCYFDECYRDTETSIRIGEKTNVKVCSVCASAFAKGVCQ